MNVLRLYHLLCLTPMAALMVSHSSVTAQENGHDELLEEFGMIRLELLERIDKMKKLALEHENPAVRSEAMTYYLITMNGICGMSSYAAEKAALMDSSRDLSIYDFGRNNGYLQNYYVGLELTLDIMVRQNQPNVDHRLWKALETFPIGVKEDYQLESRLVLLLIARAMVLDEDRLTNWLNNRINKSNNSDLKGLYEFISIAVLSEKSKDVEFSAEQQNLHRFYQVFSKAVDPSWDGYVAKPDADK